MRYDLDSNPTIFGKILRKDFPCEFIYEDEHAVAFRDINPKADVHVLIIPKQHIESLQDVQEADAALLGHLLVVVNKVAEKLGVRESGYRLITNAGKGAGQEVPHLHFHLLAGPEVCKLGGL